MRSPHLSVKRRAPTSCVKFLADTQHLGGFSTPVENSKCAEGDLPAFEQGCAERCDTLRMSATSAYGHGRTSLFIAGPNRGGWLC